MQDNDGKIIMSAMFITTTKLKTSSSNSYFQDYFSYKFSAVLFLHQASDVDSVPTLSNC